MQQPRISSKLLKIFLVQLGLISAVAIMGVFAAAFVTEEILVKQALQGEAAYFWQRYRNNPEASLPTTLNLTGYISNHERNNVPTWLEGTPAGLHRIQHNGHQPIVHVSQRNNTTLYLVFNEKQVTRLSLFFGIAPLVLVLLVLYGLAYLSYSLAKRAFSPILQLASHMESVDVNQYESQPLNLDHLKLNADAETLTLIDAIEAFLGRLTQFIHREKNFTRYASHELRTPLAVIKGSVANLQTRKQDEPNQKQIERINKTIVEMETLLETLLLLAREENLPKQQECILINDAAALIVEQFQLSELNPDLRIRLQQNAFLNLECSAKLFNIVLSNLISNALAHTDQGEILVTIDASSFRVTDTGKGIKPESVAKIFDPFYREDQCATKGFGLGLSIVQKICDQFGWQVSVESELNQGSTFTVTVKPLT